MWVKKQWCEACTLHIVRDRYVRGVAKRWVEVDEFDQGTACHTCDRLPRDTNEQRNAGVDVVVRLLAPTTVFAKFPSVISPDNDDRVLIEAEFRKSTHQLAETRIDKADRGVVSML